MKQTIEEKIKQRRLQILVHSYIYYVLNDNIVSDQTWSKWAKELVQLQKKYPNKSKKIIYHDQFIEFDGSTGMDFVYDDKIRNTALKLMEIVTNRVVVKNPKSKVMKSKKKVKKFTGRKLF